MNEKTIEDALNLLISGELDLVDTALGEISNIKTYAEAGILTRDSGLVLRMEDGSEFQITIKQSKWATSFAIVISRLLVNSQYFP